MLYNNLMYIIKFIVTAFLTNIDPAFMVFSLLEFLFKHQISRQDLGRKMKFQYTGFILRDISTRAGRFAEYGNAYSAKVHHVQIL